MPRYRVAVDTGGTFSDFVYLNEDTGAVSVGKIPSTPDDPSRAILQGVEALIGQGVRRGRCRLLLSRHHGRHQRAARGQGRQDRPLGHRRFSRHLRSGRAGAALRHRDLRRHVRQADDAGAAEPDRRSQGARRFPRRCAGAARRGRAARDFASGSRRKTSKRSPCACCFHFFIPSTKRASVKSRARKCRAAISRCPAKSCRRSASTTG